MYDFICLQFGQSASMMRSEIGPVIHRYDDMSRTKAISVFEKLYSNSFAESDLRITVVSQGSGT